MATYRASEYRLPQLPDRPSCHCATVTDLPDGRLLAVWYAGTEEAAPDVALLASYFDGNEWAVPTVLLDTPGLPDGNPTLWTDPEGTVWLFHVVIHGRGWSSVLPYYRTSTDCGNSWSESRLFCERQGLMFRSRPLLLPTGRLILPAYDEIDWTGVCYLSDDRGATWRPSGPMAAPKGYGCIQPAVVQRRDGTLCAYLRTGSEGTCIWRSESRDGGETWSQCTPTPWPNPNSGIDLIRATSGGWILACNPISRGRHRLTLALSPDEGISWTEYVVEDEPGEEFSYPVLLQEKPGPCHLLYTHKRQSIRHVRFEAAWLAADYKGELPQPRP